MRPFELRGYARLQQVTPSQVANRILRSPGLRCAIRALLLAPTPGPEGGSDVFQGSVTDELKDGLGHLRRGLQAWGVRRIFDYSGDDINGILRAR